MDRQTEGQFAVCCLKIVRIRGFSCPYFPVFGLTKNICSINLCIQFEYGKYGPRKTPNWETLHESCVLLKIP